MAADFETTLSDGPLKPVYVLAGEHPLLYQRALAKLVERVVEPATRAFNYDAFRDFQGCRRVDDPRPPRAPCR